MPGPPLYLYRPLPFHTVGADSISARAPSPLRPTNPRVALLYSLYVRAVRGISPALKTARRAVFALRYADAGPGLFDSRGLKNNPQDCFLPPAGGRPVRFLARKHQKKLPSLSWGAFFGDPCGNRTDILYVFALQFFVLTYNLQFDIVFNVSSRYLLWCRTVVFPYLSPPSLQSMQRGGFFVLIILLQIFNSFIMF